MTSTTTRRPGDPILAIIGDPTRRAMLEMLRRKPLARATRLKCSSRPGWPGFCMIHESPTGGHWKYCASDCGTSERMPQSAWCHRLEMHRGHSRSLPDGPTFRGVAARIQAVKAHLRNPPGPAFSGGTGPSSAGHRRQWVRTCDANYQVSLILIQGVSQHFFNIHFPRQA